MKNVWKYAPLGGGAVSPEADWFAFVGDVNGPPDPVLTDRTPRPSTIRLGRATGAALLSAYRKRSGLPKLEAVEEAAASCPAWLKKLRSEIRLSQGAFDQLSAFIADGGETLDLAVSLTRAGYAGFAARMAIGEGGCAAEDATLLDFGVGLNKSVYAKGVVRETGSGPGAAESTALTGDEVIMAIIDDGIAFAHDRFRLGPTETRFEYFWAMDARPDPQGPGDSVGCTHGRSLRKSEIDALLRRYGSDNDSAIYQACGLLDFAKDQRQPLRIAQSHGTHVLDVATGFDHSDRRQRQSAAKRPIIGVELPAAIVADTSGALTPPYLQEALDRVYENAVELADRIGASRGRPVRYLPMVLNFSFGVFAGPLDGHGPIERMIDAFLARYRALPGGPECQIVLPAGNSYLEETVAQPQAGTKGAKIKMAARVLPDDKTVSFIHIWLPERPAGSAQAVSVAAVPPTGGPSQRKWTKRGKALEWVRDGVVLARLYHRTVSRPGGMEREQIVLCTRATETEGLDVPRCPSGLWRLIVRNEDLPAEATVEFRIQRDDPLYGQVFKGRQAYFDMPSYVRYEVLNGRLRQDASLEKGPVTRKGTLNAYAGSPNPVVVAGYRRSDGHPALYSSGGPLKRRPDGPDLAAVSEESYAAYGVIGAGTHSGSTIAQNGTSVAAPMVARVLAAEIEAGTPDPVSALKLAVAKQEASGIVGPHGLYEPNQPTRAGVGRVTFHSMGWRPSRIES